MMLPVRPCPHCRLLMWVKEENVEYPDHNTIRFKCPHCHAPVRLTLVTQGQNAAGPKMGH